MLVNLKILRNVLIMVDGEGDLAAPRFEEIEIKLLKIIKNGLMRLKY